MTKKEFCKRCLLMLIGLFFVALGIAFTKTAALGVSPVSSVANVLSLRFTQISIGNWLIITNCILILAQVLILRRKFKLFQLLQFPVSFLIGYFTDFGMWLVSFIPSEAYPVRLAMVLVGVAVLGFGITLSVQADVVMNAGEAFVKVLADTLRKSFGTVKVIFDMSYVSLSILLSLLLFEGQIVGTREGTLITATCTGLTVKLFTRLLKEPIGRFLAKESKPEQDRPS